MNKTSNVMHCWNCGREMSTRKGRYEYASKFLGHLSVPCETGELYTCDCGESPYVSSSLSARIAQMEQQRIEQLLLLSVGDDMSEFKKNLMGMSDLERELGVTRQAIWKAPKYRNRIYHVVINGDILWWRPSVERFKKSGDGRFTFGPIKSAAQRRLLAIFKMLRELLPRRSAALFAF